MAGELTSFGLSRGMALIQGGGGPPPAPTLNALTVSPSSATVGQLFNGAVSGKTSGSSLALSGPGAAGLSIAGTTISGTPSTEGAVNIVETLAGATGSPRTSNAVVTVVAGAQMVAFADDFAGGANNTDLSARSGWTKVDGGRAAQTTGANSVKHVAGAAPDSAYVVTDLQTPKHYVECTWQSTANSTTFGIAGRMIDGANYAAIRRNGTQWQLFTCLAGAFTQLGSSPQDVVIGDKIRMEFDGDFVTCYRNDVVFIGVAATQMNAPTLAAATKAGTLVRAAVAPLIGNFKAGGMA